MSEDDVPGYMLDEVVKTLRDIEVTTEDELHEYVCDEGGQTTEELGYDLMVMYLRSKNENDSKSSSRE